MGDVRRDCSPVSEVRGRRRVRLGRSGKVGTL